MFSANFQATSRSRSVPRDSDRASVRRTGMTRSTRRDFLKASLAGAALCGVGGVAAGAKTAKRSATDWGTLGRSNIKVTRLAFGTGTHGGRLPRGLGQEGFTRLVRPPYGRAIPFFHPPHKHH